MRMRVLNSLAYYTHRHRFMFASRGGSEGGPDPSKREVRQRVQWWAHLDSNQGTTDQRASGLGGIWKRAKFLVELDRT